jgi:hypothetical protein
MCYMLPFHDNDRECIKEAILAKPQKYIRTRSGLMTKQPPLQRKTIRQPPLENLLSPSPDQNIKYTFARPDQKCYVQNCVLADIH